MTRPCHGALALAFNAAADLAGAVYDVGSKFIDDVMDAYARVVEAVWAGVVSVKDAWDNLDSGLKQWIVMGVSMAVSFIPLVGPLISCIIDGTFVDMIKALSTGDWATLGMCALAFVPGGKIAGKLGAFAKKATGFADNLGKYAKAVKKVPNPGGRLGGLAHRAKVAETVKDIESRGLRVKTEFYVKGDGVRRFADVAALDKKGNPVEIYQIGKARLDGLPIAREQRAINDIESITGIKVTFVPYNL